MSPRCVSLHRPTDTRRIGSGAGSTALAACGLLVVVSLPAHALTIVPTFDSSITGSAYATTIEGAINDAAKFYTRFSNPISVSVDYKLAPSGAGYLGGSYSSYYFSSYLDYGTSLAQDAAAHHNDVAASAAAHLSSGNTADLIRATSADFRALGFSAAGVLNSSGSSGGTFDGVILLNADYLLGFGGAGSYPPTQTIQHEIDEVLGIGGAGSVLNLMQQSGLTSKPTVDFGNGPQTYIGPMDQYRYASAGTPSLNTSGSATSYFSTDGGTSKLVLFNQNKICGDYGDWGEPDVRRWCSRHSPAPHPTLR